jgi:hypothetical protein
MEAEVKKCKIENPEELTDVAIKLLLLLLNESDEETQ